MPVELLGSADSLDRQSGRRADRAYLDSLADAACTRWLVLCGLDPVLRATPVDMPGNPWFHRHILEAHGVIVSSRVFLGVSPETATAHFACRIDLEQREQLAATIPVADPSDFRSVASAGGLASADVALLGLARSLFAWHDANRHCGWCGSASIGIDGGWKRHCEACAKDLFPRIDPVVIMLVTDGERCVLAREPRFPERMFSTIAGYVEPGEDIAHAVRRETHEELGLSIDRVTQLSSQPWPFPHSLMIGCIAHCRHAELTIDPTEIVEAQWFTRAEASAMLARQHPTGLWVPGPQAIAHHLIRAFVDQV